MHCTPIGKEGLSWHRPNQVQISRANWPRGEVTAGRRPASGAQGSLGKPVRDTGRFLELERPLLCGAATGAAGGPPPTTRTPQARIPRPTGAPARRDMENPEKGPGGLDMSKINRPIWDKGWMRLHIAPF